MLHVCILHQNLAVIVFSFLGCIDRLFFFFFNVTCELICITLEAESFSAYMVFIGGQKEVFIFKLSLITTLDCL